MGNCLNTGECCELTDGERHGVAGQPGPASSPLILPHLPGLSDGDGVACH